MALLSAAAAAHGLVGCGLACTEMLCSASVLLKLVDSAGNPIEAMKATGTIRAGDRTIEVRCSADVLCSGNTLVLNDVAQDQPELTVDLADGAGHRYAGTVQPAYTVNDDFNGPGCGECTSGGATVTLQ